MTPLLPLLMTIAGCSKGESSPNKMTGSKINGNKETDVLVEDNHFTAPMEKGVYYYSYGVWRMDKKEANVSNSDAFYAFVLEVR